MERLAREALSATQAVVRLPPSADSFPLIVAATQRGPTLAIVPQASDAALLVRRLRRGGIAAALLPGEWAVAAAGTAVAVGPRSAAWATVPHLGAAVVVDAHDELLVAESTPTWSAWVVAAERARRAGVPCVLISPCPTLEQLRWGRLVTPARTVERAGWARIAVIDRRREDPRTGMISSRLVDALRRATPEQRVVCVLNRKGRARLLACGACYALVRCERCGAALSQFDDALQCAACGLRRPIVCAQCGATRLRALRPGVSRLRDDLEALAQRPAAEVTAETAALPGAAILVGTEAVLHRLIPTQVASVALLDFDASLLAPHHRAAEEAMALLVRCARLAGRRDSDGEVIVQTRLPDHPVLVAAVRADPDRASVADARVRGELGLPPYSAAAIVSGAGAQAYVEGLRQHPGVRVDGPLGDRWFARAPDHHVLCDALSAAERPSARVRIEVDPRRL
jgi:primosomal protein N' (replication factor Y)